jgi:Icc-related predicted phosphoesterase
MKILVIGDLHGRKPIIKNKDFDCMVVVGDICDDRDIAPIYKKFFAYLKDVKEESPNFEEFAKKHLRGKATLKKLEEKSVKHGNKILKYLDTFDKPIFMVAGNWDKSYGPSRIKDHNKNSYNYSKAFYDWWLGSKINPKLTKATKNISSLMYQTKEFKGINFIGYGLSSAPETMKHKKSLRKNLTKNQIEKLKAAYQKIQNKLASAYKKRKNKRLPTFFVTHNIPYNTRLDIVTDKKSYAYKKHLGSTIARTFCQKFQPLICVGGHIHDHRGKDKIKNTTVVNTGFGAKSTVLIEIDVEKKNIKKITFMK